MDFFTVPTLTFGILYCFFVISHGKPRMLHFNITLHPTIAWVIQQLREALSLGLSTKLRIIGERSVPVVFSRGV